jgi:arylsulfatase A-like enzyme/Flp pilus assembly protein TadD
MSPRPAGFTAATAAASAPVAALAATLALTAAAGCSPAPPEGEPPARVLLITLDTTRADRLGCYGYRGGSTPNLDRLASRGVVFANAVAPTPITLPSHATLFTGAYPARHGVRNNGTFRLGPDLPTLAERFRAAGYRTGAVVGSAMLGSRFGLERGFDHYDDAIPRVRNRERLVAERTASEVTARALEWIRDQAAARWFLWVHYFDPHFDYAPPEPFASRFRAQPYDGELAYMDDEIGRLLEGLGSPGPPGGTLVAAAGDHGESLGEHGERSHGIFIYSATMRIPLILVWEGRLPPGRRIEGIVSLADLAPTICDLAGLDPLGGPGGESLVGAIRAGGAPARPVLLESWLPRLNYGWSSLSGIQDQRWKYIRAPRPELYDLEDDPDETRNLHPLEGTRAARLDLELEESLRRHGGSGGAGSLAPAARVDSETRSLLRSLGYLGGIETVPGREATPDGDGASLPDPKDKIGEFLETSEALLLMAVGRYEEAVGRLEKAGRANPGSVFVRRHLGNAYRKLGRLPEAEEHLREAVRLSPRNPDALLDLAGFLFERSRSGSPVREAESLARRALELSPDLASAHHLLGAIHNRRGEVRAAIAEYRRALALDPAAATTLGNLAILLEARGETDEALSLYLRAAEADPENPRPLISAAWIHFKRQELQEAARLLRRAAAESPKSPAPLTALAQVLEKAGDRDGAVEAMKEAVAREPGRPAKWQELARLQLRIGDPCGALATLESAPVRSPADTDRARRACARSKN